VTPEDFQAVVWDYYAANGRTMPWRDDPSPYRVLVSELMLQQTQVARVISKFTDFIESFPTVQALADTSLADVLVCWQGLGYNRRAKFLHETAKKIVNEFDGEFPATLQGMTELPGVGRNTAGAILAYAFEKRAVFVETNIRTVFFHCFFADNKLVDDREILALVERTLPTEHIREWYWALMDYGSYLKRAAGGRLDTSAHYKKQAPLKGSVREVRGQIVRVLSQGPLTETALRRALAADDRFEGALDGLVRDGLVSRHADLIGLTA
jgi:A/G-specific adenine glycosylase